MISSFEMCQIPIELCKGRYEDQELPTMINLGEGAETIVAGGAIRNWFLGRKNKSDIDIFFLGGKEYLPALVEQFLKVNKLKEADKVFSSDTAATYKNAEVCGGLPIQLIKLGPYHGVFDVFNAFDFTVCQFAEDHDGHLYTTSSALTGVLTGHLGVNQIQPGYELDSLRRSYKYAAMGFKPCRGTLIELAEAIRRVDVNAFAEEREISRRID